MKKVLVGMLMLIMILSIVTISSASTVKNNVEVTKNENGITRTSC